MTEIPGESGGHSRRGLLIRTAKASAALTALGVLGNISQGCGGGGGGGSGGGGGGGGSQVTVAAATKKAGSAGGTSSYQSVYQSTLYTNVSAGGRSASGNLNYSPFQAQGADIARVNTGTNITWTSTTGGGSVSLTA